MMQENLLQVISVSPQISGLLTSFAMKQVKQSQAKWMVIRLAYFEHGSATLREKYVW